MNITLPFFIKRLAWGWLVVLGVGTIAFFIARTLPGDPTRMLTGPQASAADVAHARAIYGLDEPLGRQYMRFWGRLLHRAPGASNAKAHPNCATPVAGLHIDLGYSFVYRKPVVDLIAKKAPASLQLAIAAMLLQILLGLGVGVAAARKRGSFFDRAAIGLVLLGVCAPTFVTGLALQYFLAYRLGWLPFDGYGTSLAEQLRHIALPAITLGLYGSALYARMARDETSLTLASDYVRTARAKGASELRTTVVHALRNALIPISTLMVLQFGALVGGAIVTEKLFRWPGMGAMAVTAMVNRDGPVIMGTVLFAAAAIVAATLLLDVVHVLIDPRMRRARPPQS